MVPKVAGMFQVSNNALFIQIAMASGSLDFVASPRLVQIFPGGVATSDAVQALGPPSGRTSGSIRFAMQIPQV